MHDVRYAMSESCCMKINNNRNETFEKCSILQRSRNNGVAYAEKKRSP
jgi:hypothetical protein